MHVQKHTDKEVVEESGIKSLGNVIFDELYGHDLDMGANESPFDTKSRIKFVGKANPTLNLTNQGAGSLLADKELTKADSDLESMPDDEIESVSGFEVDTNDDEKNCNEHKEELSKTDEAIVDNMIDELVDMAYSKDASADKPAQSDPLGHLHAEISSLSVKVENLESSLSHLKNILPQIIMDSVKKTLPKFDKRVKKSLKAQVSDIVLKPLYKEFNALNKMESTRFVTLQKHLNKAIRTKVGKSVQRNVRKEIRTMNELLRCKVKHQMQLIKYLEQMVHSHVKVARDIMVVNAQQLEKKIEKNTVDILELVNLIQELISMIDPVPASPKAVTEGDKVSTQPKSDQVKETEPADDA
ncbi:hypothetical protein Tco_0819570 [Tanacetum coccineum]|uniref:Uncharacterized protein n=1 Tax=Tanacetum coccineum TaxID=301880 RepID=A0ABQ5A6Y8_9ASTR